MRVLALTHGPRVRSERFGEIVREQGHELVEWELPTQGPPPDGFDAVMVFGGRMNVGEEADNPWLDDEYELLRGWVAAELPLLGVCLGGQTLAHATGGHVGRASQSKAGFYEVTLKPDADTAYEPVTVTLSYTAAQADALHPTSSKALNEAFRRAVKVERRTQQTPGSSPCRAPPESGA